MKKISKMIKVLIGAVILLAVCVAISDFLKTQKDSQSMQQSPASSEGNGLPAGEDESQPSESVIEEGNGPASVQESTPEERAERTAVPSDAASYSEEDLPPELQ